MHHPDDFRTLSIPPNPLRQRCERAARAIGNWDIKRDADIIDREFADAELLAVALEEVTTELEACWRSLGMGNQNRHAASGRAALKRWKEQP